MSWSSAYRIALILPFLFFASGCNENEPPTGPPTPLGKEGPMSAVCEIQREFKKLRKPVFTKIKYHEPWTDTRLAAGTTRFSEYYEVILSKDAHQFLGKHSPLEISTSLAPLIIEEENGADALTVLYAMAFHGKRRNLQPLFPGFIFRKYKDEPFPAEYVTAFFPKNDKPGLQQEILQDKRTWDEEQRLRYLRGHHATGRFSNNKRRVPNTLEQKIMDILDHLATAKPRWDDPDWFDSPSLDGRFRNLESALNTPPVYPTVGENFQEFRRADDPELVATVLLSQANIMALGVFLGIHESYWPIYTKNWRQDGIPQHEAYLYKLRMESEVAKTVHDYCK